MKRRTLSLLLLCLLAVGVILPARAAEGDRATALFETITTSRLEAGRPTLARAEGLDKIAAAYADILCKAGNDFRKATDFKTLPDGEKVIALASRCGVAVSGFNYSVFYGAGARPETTNEYRSKAVEGDFTRVGIACQAGADGCYVTVLIYDKSVGTEGTATRLYDYNALYDDRNTSDVGAALKGLQIPSAFAPAEVAYSLDQGRLEVGLPLALGPGETYRVNQTAQMQDCIVLFALFDDIQQVDYSYTQADYGLVMPITRAQADQAFGGEIAPHGASREVFAGTFASRVEALSYTLDVKSVISYDEDILYQGEPEDTVGMAYKGFP